MPASINPCYVTLTGGFLYEKERLAREVALPALLHSYEQTGRVRALQLNWRRGEPCEPHIFWDSDVAKWIEGAAYALTLMPDPELEATVDGLIADMVAGQTAEGYFNTRYLTEGRADRFTRRDDHELYCAGHLMEAAVAYYHATGKDAMLRMMCRYADYIEMLFMNPARRADFQTPGHEEIELALVKLYEATGEERYLTLARQFIDRRGIPEAQVQHATWFGLSYAQDHAPVREQDTAEGHSVRALYLYAGMADLARLDNDDALRAACEKLFDNIVQKRMYVTGGIGGNYHGEAFSYDYDLPNELAYAETCASIAMIFFTQRMFLLTGAAKYIEVMEQMLYNNVSAGFSVSGDRFFYTNPLEVHPERRAFFNQHGHGQYAPECERPGDFGCSCCPPNVIRLFTSIRGYMYHTDNDRLYVNLYDASVMEWDGLRIEQETHYPWDGTVTLKIHASEASHRTLCLRIPGWCVRYHVSINGESMATQPDNGYIILDQVWQDGDTVLLGMDMPVTEIYAHPAVHYNAGRVAICRGPVVYCAEGADNGAYGKSAVLKKDAAYRWAYERDLLGGVVTIACDARVPAMNNSAEGSALHDMLYRSKPFPTEERTLRLIPYAVWANRGPNEMNVWLLKEM